MDDDKQKIKARLIIESQGTSEDTVRRSLKMHIETMKKIQGGEVGDVKEAEPQQSEDTGGLWSGLIDVGINADDFESFMAYVIGAGPTSVVIMEPRKMEITNRELQNVTNDFTNLLHGLAKLNVKLKIDNYILAKLLDRMQKGEKIDFHDEAKKEAERAAKTLEGEGPNVELRGKYKVVK